MQHPDEGMIHSWLDSDLSPEEAGHIDQHVAGCAQCAAAVAEARGLVAASSRILIALDDMPGNVIPVSPPRRQAWYSRSGVRAAAAVLFVASASLLVARNREDMSPRAEMARVISDTEPMQSVAADAANTEGKETAGDVPNEPATDRTRSDFPPASATRRSAAAAMRARKAVSARTSTGPAENQLSGRVSGVAAKAAASPAPRRLETSRLDEAVVTGVITAEDTESSAPLRKLREDSIGSVRRTVYEVSPGVEVTLGEGGPAGFSARNLSAGVMQRAGSVPSVVKSAPAPSAVPQATATVKLMNTISWTDSATGKHYTLTGPLSADVLEEVKARMIRQRK